MNTLSEFAKEIMLAGLDKSGGIPVQDSFGERLVGNIFDVPEKPEGYNFNFVKPRDTVAVLVTGGLDSSALYYMAEKSGRNVKAFYVDIGQPYAYKEISALEIMGIPFELVKPDVKLDASKFWKHIIPGRNFYFLSLVAEMIQGGEIWFGATNGEMPVRGGDKSLAFIHHCNELFSHLPYKVEVKTPLAQMTKGEIVAWWKKHVPLEKLKVTVSCFDGEVGACGKCQSCLRKALAFASNRLELETEVDVREGCKQYIEKYLTVLNEALKNEDFSHYSKKRALEDLLAIKILTGRS